MGYFRRSAFLRLFLLPFTLTLWLTSCTSYKMLSPPYEQSIARENPGQVRVTLNDDTRWKVAEPGIVADSLVGLDSKSWDRDRRAYTRSIRVALSDVYSVEGKETRTSALMIVGIGLASVFAIGLISCASSDEDLC